MLLGVRVLFRLGYLIRNVVRVRSALLLTSRALAGRGNVQAAGQSVGDLALGALVAERKKQMKRAERRNRKSSIRGRNSWRRTRSTAKKRVAGSAVTSASLGTFSVRSASNEPPGQRQ